MSLESKRGNPHYKALIQSTRWRKLRAAYIAAHPLCARCLACGRTTPASEIHHIAPLESYCHDLENMRALCFDERNLMSVCRACHGAIHAELGERSAAAQVRRCGDKARSFKERFFADEP